MVSMAVADRRKVGISLSSARRAEHLDLGGRSSRVGKVTVPAGTFDTVHLTGIRKTLTGSKGTANEDMWYAPDVKRHIKHERYTASGPYIYEQWVEELTSFELR
jgi:hypothetical protein